MGLRLLKYTLHPSQNKHIINFLERTMAFETYLYQIKP